MGKALTIQNTVVLVKTQASEGQLAAMNAVNDACLVENVSISFDPNIIETNELTGSKDDVSPIVGGMKASITVDVLLAGTSTPGTSPQWAPFMLAAGCAEILTAANIPVAPENAAAGSANTLTLGAGATALKNIYQGMPLSIEINPAAGDITPIMSYTAAKVATLGQDYDPVLDATTTYQVLANTLYKCADEVHTSLEIFIDGLKYTFIDLVADASFTITSGGIAKLSFKLDGLLGNDPKIDDAVPAATYDVDSNGKFMRPQPWINGKMYINNVARGVSTFNIGLNNQTDFIDNPNAQDGYDAPQVVSRKVGGDIDPNEVLINVQDLFTMMRTNTVFPIMLQWGVTPGNRFILCVPDAQAINAQPGDKNKTAKLSLPFRGTGVNNGFFLAVY